MALVTMPRKGADLESVRKALVQLSDRLSYLLSCQEDSTAGLLTTLETLEQAQGSQQTALETQKQQQKTLRQQIIDTAYEITVNYKAALQVLKESIESTVSESYVAKSAYGELTDDLTSKVTQTSTDITNLFTKVETVEGDLGSYKETVAGWQRFTADGIELGQEGSPFTALLGSTKLSFRQNNVEIAFISNNRLEITAAQVTDSFQFGTAARGIYRFESTGDALVIRKGV